VSEILEGVVRFVLELLLRIAVLGPGHLILRTFRRETDPVHDDVLAACCGVAFWTVVGLGVWAIVALVW
jgi:hypothetical protein